MVDDELEQKVRLIIMEIMMVLYKNNIRTINIGALMRLIGIGNDHAAEHDNEYMEIDKEFAKYMEAMSDTSTAQSSNQTLH